MDRKYSRLLCRAIPNSSITCPPSPAIMRLRRVRFSNGATNLYWVRLYTAQYVVLTWAYPGIKLVLVPKKRRNNCYKHGLSAREERCTGSNCDRKGRPTGQEFIGSR